MLIKEFRVVLPMTVEEYQVAQLWSVAEMSKNETGGGDGVEVVFNEPFDASPHPADGYLPAQEPVDPQLPACVSGRRRGDPYSLAPSEPLLDRDPRWNHGQYTLKWYHLTSKVPRFIRMLAPKGSLDFLEEAWNAFPYCRTIITNPGYMGENFFIKIETIHLPDAGTNENAHNLPAELLARRQVQYIDIANDPITSEYSPECDPRVYKSQKTGRGPLVGSNWRLSVSPVMCCYKLVTCNFKWFGLQTRIEDFIQVVRSRELNAYSISANN
jgi:hypothetical protein